MPQISEPELIERELPLDPEMNLHYMPGYTNDTVIHNAMLDEALPSILVVDDEEECKTFLQDYFQVMGY